MGEEAIIKNDENFDEKVLRHEKYIKTVEFYLQTFLLSKKEWGNYSKW